MNMSIIRPLPRLDEELIKHCFTSCAVSLHSCASTDWEASGCSEDHWWHSGVGMQSKCQAQSFIPLAEERRAVGPHGGEGGCEQHHYDVMVSDLLCYSLCSGFDSVVYILVFIAFWLLSVKQFFPVFTSWVIVYSLLFIPLECLYLSLFGSLTALRTCAPALLDLFPCYQLIPVWPSPAASTCKFLLLLICSICSHLGPNPPLLLVCQAHLWHMRVLRSSSICNTNIMPEAYTKDISQGTPAPPPHPPTSFSSAECWFSYHPVTVILQPINQLKPWLQSMPGQPKSQLVCLE